MSNNVQNQYTPDYVSPPGETLLEILEERGLSQAELAQRMGRPKKTINEIIKGKTAITPETALQLERVLRVRASFWNNREQNYRQYLARKREEEFLESHIDWVKKFPINAMVSDGWIEHFDDQVEQLQELLSFFGVASPDQWEDIWGNASVAFRKSTAYPSNREATSAWIRQGEIESQDIHCQPYSAKKFRDILNDVRELTTEPPEVFQFRLVNLCASTGVSVVFVRQLPDIKVSGVTRWLSPQKAMIQLSLRYKKNDHFWFTFFHEAGHILLHSKKNIFLEAEDVTEDIDVKEKEANDFAARTLIPQSEFSHFIRQQRAGYYPSKKSIREFANSIGIHPGIVVGRLQHEKYLPFSHCNDLKITLEWAD